jgi:IS4 transposase
LPDASDLYGELSDEVITTNLPPEVMGTRNITSGDEYWTWDMYFLFSWLFFYNVIDTPKEKVLLKL